MSSNKIRPYLLSLRVIILEMKTVINLILHWEPFSSPIK